MFQPNKNCEFIFNHDMYDDVVVFAVHAWTTSVPKEFGIIYERAGFGHGSIKLVNTTKEEIDDLLYDCYTAAYKAGFLKMAGDIEEMIGRYSK